MKLSDDEKDLIAAIRNYRKAYPNGQDQLRFYAQRLFDDLMDVFKD